MLGETDIKDSGQTQTKNETENNIFSDPMQYPESVLANNFNKYQLDTRYISQICCPRRVRSSLPHVRMRPYFIPKRSRTKSENSDPTNLLYLETLRTIDAIQGSNNTTLMMETSDPATSQMDTSSQQLVSHKSDKCNSLVKSKSLESLVRVIKSIEGSQPSHEMEFVSSRIQKLKVQE
ncbi:uncharacterized protein LOC131692137 [Topomyia yanbarensis]|uniref:uncharacterized protein LOC131692137 n=1 Tax=Topomyia yanbarensis TaxID=2498891 RepID=UPI00273B3E28|nr:uncharacterized protein LOC131692137 [Topomyia yanbarensis]